MEVSGVPELSEEMARLRVPGSRLFEIGLIDEEDELDFNEILRLADEGAEPPQDN